MSFLPSSELTRSSSTTELYRSSSLSAEEGEYSSPKPNEQLFWKNLNFRIYCSSENMLALLGWLTPWLFSYFFRLTIRNGGSA